MITLSINFLLYFSFDPKVPLL